VTAVRVIVEGRVQGVGYRAWVSREAQSRNLSGWVRNRGDGSVEAVFAGDQAKVAAMVEACRSGPGLAVVSNVRQEAWSNQPPTGFSVRPSQS
jgi:acylphosphatase